MTIYLKNRMDNTFDGRPFLEEIKLLNKPAITPTIMDDDKIKKQEQEEESKKVNINNQNYPMKKKISNHY